MFSSGHPSAGDGEEKEDENARDEYYKQMYIIILEQVYPKGKIGYMYLCYINGLFLIGIARYTTKLKKSSQITNQNTVSVSSVAPLLPTKYQVLMTPSSKMLFRFCFFHEFSVNTISQDEQLYYVSSYYITFYK